VLIVVVASTATALIKGHSAAAGGVGLLIGLALVALWGSPGGSASGADASSRNEERSPGQPFCREFGVAWANSRSDVVDAVRSIGLRLVLDGGHTARFEGGSQVRTRLLGGYFVNPIHLPITVTVTETDASDDALIIEIRDRLGPIAVRDRAFESRFELRAQEIQDRLDCLAAGPAGRR